MNEYLTQSLMVLGLLALIVEAAVFGFSLMVLFFLGLSLLLAGLAMWLGLIPETLLAAMITAGMLTGLLSAVLWKPLRRMQESRSPSDVRGDFAREPFVLAADVDSRGLSEHRYSGIVWKLRSQTPLAAGTLVEVERVEVGVLWVKARESGV